MIRALQHDTSVDEEKGLDYIKTRANEERARLSPPLPPLSIDEYLDFLFKHTINDYARQYKEALKQDVGGLLDNASDDVIAQVYAILGKPVATPTDDASDVGNRDPEAPSESGVTARVVRALKFWK